MAPPPAPMATPTFTEPPPAPPGAPMRRGWPWWPLVGAAVAVLLAGLWWWQRTRAAEPEASDDADTRIAEASEDPSVADPSPVVVPPPLPPPLSATERRAPTGLVTSALRPAIGFALRPIEAGIDTLRTTLDFVLTVHNTGRATAEALTVEAWLFGAGPDPRGEALQFVSRPAGQPLMPPFAMPASASADFTSQAAAPREQLGTINVGDRRLFVPVLVVRARWHDARGTPGEAEAAFMVGVERAGQTRLAPLALDRGTRTWRTLAVRDLALG